MLPISPEDIRLVNENLDRSQITIYLHSTEKPIIRTIESAELHRFTNIRAHEGMANAKIYICTLINEKYLQPQHISKVQLSPEESRLFELRHHYQLGILDDADKEEYFNLLQSGSEWEK